MTHLNESQQTAVTHGDGHALVLAGAGTGKTTTLLARAKELLRRGVRPDELILVTFTRRATREIRERLTHDLGDTSSQIRVGTFHRICLDLMRLEPDAFDMRAFTVIDEDDREQLMRLARGAVLPNDQSDKSNLLPKASQLVQWYSYARNANIPISVYLQTQKLFEDAQLALVISVYTEYDQRKANARYLDYDDILWRCAAILTQRKDIRDRIVSRFRHVLVDEIQDTSKLQWLLLHALRQKAQLFCVGDDAQSIYAFRGADFATVHHFDQLVKGGTVYRLTDNYRSTQEILDISNWLLAQSPLPYNKKLAAVRGMGPTPLLVECDDDLGQGQWVAGDIQRRRATGVPWQSMTVLVRTAYAARAIEAALIEKAIPYVFMGGTSLLKAAHVRDLLALLRVVINQRDEVAWMRYLTLFKGIGDRTAERWIQQIAACSDLSQVTTFLYRAKPEPQGPAMPVMHVLSGEQTPVAVVQAALDAMTPLLSVKYQFEQWEQRVRDLELLVRVAERFRSLDAFVEEFVLDPLHASQFNPPDDAVVISTVHAAKGTECDVVYLARADIGQYPHSMAKDEAEVEEERRVLYVALTRAKDELIIVRSPELIGTWGVHYTFLDTLPAGLTNRVAAGNRRREAWRDLLMSGGVIPDIEE
jgi:DNA helicase-2/ATP-dependent DNA helicase PcrA